MKKFLIMGLLLLAGVFSQTGFAQVNLAGQEAHGSCVRPAYHQRYHCYFPGKAGMYSNVREIVWNGASGADVWWCKMNSTTSTINADAGANGSRIAKRFEAGISASVGRSNTTTKYKKGKCYKRVIGSTQYGQNPTSINPFRGNGVVRIQVKPHNDLWSTEFILRGE